MGLTNEEQGHKKIPQKVSVIDFCSAPHEFNFQILFPFNLKEWPMPVSQLLLGQIRSLEGGAHILEGRGCYLNKYWRGGVLSHQGGAPHSMWIGHSSTQVDHRMGHPTIKRRWPNVRSGWSQGTNYPARHIDRDSLLS